MNLSAPEGASVNDGVSSRGAAVCRSGRRRAVSAATGGRSRAREVGPKGGLPDGSRASGGPSAVGSAVEGAGVARRALPFELRSAPKIFSAVGDALLWVMREKGVYLRPSLPGRFLVFGSERLGELAAGTGNVSDAGFSGGAAKNWRPGDDAGVPWHRNRYGERRAAPAGREAATTAGKAHGGAAFASVFASVDETRALVAY